MIAKLLSEHNLEFLSLKGGCRGSSESTLVKMSHCWKSHAAAQLKWVLMKNYCQHYSYSYDTCDGYHYYDDVSPSFMSCLLQSTCSLFTTDSLKIKMLRYRVKSGKFGHQVNSDTHLQTVEIQMRRLLMSRHIRIFTVCLVIFFSNN